MSGKHAEARDACQLHGDRVLIVQQEEVFVEELTSALREAGMNPLSVHTAAEGLSMTGLFKPVAIITALTLETHDAGFKLAADIKRNPLTNHIGIIIVTTNRESTGIEFSQEKDGKWMRTDRYFERPVDTKDIIQAAREVIDEAKAVSPQGENSGT